MITKEIAQQAKYRDEFIHIIRKNHDGTPLRARVNGKCKVWKRRPGDFELPMKHGLKRCFYITPEKFLN
jgi:hypothetical protein